MKKNIYFRHTHAASTSILTALEELGVHDPSSKAHQIQGSGLVVARVNRSMNDQFRIYEWEGEWSDDAYLWTVVRNPWARMVSVWRSLQRWAFSPRHSFDDFVQVVTEMYVLNHMKNFETLEEKTLALSDQQKRFMHVCDCAVPGTANCYTKEQLLRLESEPCGCLYSIAAHSFPLQPVTYLQRILAWEDDGSDEGVVRPATQHELEANFKRGTGFFIPGWRNIDRFVRFENLQEDFNELCDDLDLPRVQLGHSNGNASRALEDKRLVTPTLRNGDWHWSEGDQGKNYLNKNQPKLKTSNSDYTKFYKNPATIACVAKIFWWEINEFGYKFGGNI